MFFILATSQSRTPQLSHDAAVGEGGAGDYHYYYYYYQINTSHTIITLLLVLQYSLCSLLSSPAPNVCFVLYPAVHFLDSRSLSASLLLLLFCLFITCIRICLWRSHFEMMMGCGVVRQVVMKLRARSLFLLFFFSVLFRFVLFCFCFSFVCVFPLCRHTHTSECLPQ